MPKWLAEPPGVSWVLETRPRADAQPVESQIENRKSKMRMGRERSCSRPSPFQQRTNPSWRSIRSQPAVSRRLFRCLGAHLLRSPSIVKSGLNVLALVSATDGQTPSVERDRSFLPNSVSRQVTSFRCPLFSTHSFDPFVSLI